MKPETIAISFKPYRVVKRDGKVIDFEPQRIVTALTKAFLAAEHNTSDHLNKIPSRIEKTVADLTDKVINGLKRRLEFNNTVHIEDIQDQVELELMRAGEHKIARDYVLYREKHAQQRAAQPQQPAPILQVTDSNGVLQPLNEQRLHKLVKEACDGLKDVNSALVVSESLKNVFDGIGESEINRVLVMTARMLIEKEPNYTYVAARLLLDSLRTDAFQIVGKGQLPYSATASEMVDFYSTYFKLYIQTGLEYELLTPALKEFDIEKLAAALIPERDFKFTYLGFQTLFDRYFLHWDGVRFELPQAFFMRVAMGLSLNEENKEERAIEFYRLLSSFDFMSSTPTLFNSATPRSQLSSCYLTTISDDLAGIYNAIRDNALLSKFAGGLGNDWSSVRAMGSRIKGTNGKSQGVVPFMKVANDTLVAVNQGGRRKGSGCAYLETWHLDIEEFLELRKNTGDERRRTHDMNTANWIPDLFMIRVQQDADWTLFSPDETPDLHELYGKAFETAYLNYETKVAKGEIKLHKKIPAVSLWRKMLTMLFETGHPWVTFKDPCNIRSPQQHIGVVHSSNLCTEICLNTTEEEIAVCFPKGTLILTDQGQVPIENCNGFNVYVPFNKNLEEQQRYLKAKLISQGEKLVYQIITQNGIVIEATEDHPFLVQEPVNRDKPRQYLWKKLKELQMGDFLVCPLTMPIYLETGEQDKDFTAAGWMLGDGWMSSSYGVCFAPHEIFAQNFVLPILNGWHQNSKLGHNAPHSNIPTPYVQPNGVVNWHSQRQGFIEYVKEQFGFQKATGSQKHISDKIKNAEYNQIASFLSGLFSADGSVMRDKRRSKGGVTISLSSASIDLLRDVQMLLKPFGVHGRIRGMELPKRDERWQGQLDIKGAFSIYNFIHFIGFSLSPVKQQILVDFLPLLSKKSILQHSAVVSITPKEVKEVFDLSLEEDHTFIANGLAVHNCNLGSINLPAHIDENGLNQTKLAQTIQTAMRMLDNVIDINYYAVPQAEKSNLKHRPIGLGIMGFQDALYKLRIPYASQQAIDFADKTMESISYYAIQASMNLAKERGSYSTFEGSLWSRGILPIDTLQMLKDNREQYLDVDFSQRLDWAKLREQVKQFGMRNSNCMAIAPTATISNICGVTQSIEPTYQNLFVKSNLSGEFTVVNPYLAEDLKKLDLWDEVMVNDLKYFDGSVQAIDRVPNDLKQVYATAFEIDSAWLIEAAARRQKWLDQAQSLNLYMKEPSGSKLDNLYRLAWLRGLKTTYYLRSLGATHVEKNTVKSSINAIQLSSSIDAPKACLIDDPECEACQ
jgi:ribonucleoside-diphosphate reductase alpha chain